MRKISFVKIAMEKKVLGMEEKTVELLRRGLNLNVGHHCIKYLWRGWLAIKQASLSLPLSGFQRER